MSLQCFLKSFLSLHKFARSVKRFLHFPLKVIEFSKPIRNPPILTTQRKTTFQLPLNILLPFKVLNFQKFCWIRLNHEMLWHLGWKLLIIFIFFFSLFLLLCVFWGLHYYLITPKFEFMYEKWDNTTCLYWLEGY